ncbi:MAG: GNAT family N-acetyltransferase, partial [Saprospiraceae bacterium]|nr:GNAT family N-acetyltransferase [Saprospiraceae bacterium]
MESARTNISFLDPADFEEALEIFLAPGALDYIQPLRFLDRAGHLNRLYEKHDEMISGTNYHLSCRLKENKQLVALLNLSGMGGSGRKFIGYIIRKDDWGKGFASELTEWIINFAREKTN